MIQSLTRMTTQVSVDLLANAIAKELATWQNENKLQRLWANDATLWTNDDEDKWTGWLNVHLKEVDVPRINALANEIKTAGFTDIVVLGMGGSSLCPAMMAETFDHIANYPRLHVLDSTDPAQIHDLENRIDLKKTIFIVSSKSGNTLEPTIFKDYFFTRVQKALNQTNVGDRFIAITDPGSELEKTAQSDEFKAIFYGLASIGGRYSALSNFGMVPSGLMGVDVDAFLHYANEMQQRCLPSTNAPNNPGLVLGVTLGVAAQFGKNKVTLILSPGIQALGAWIEQLVAESTGKNGKGLIPIDQEPLDEPSVYSNDRVFIYIRLDTVFDQEQDDAIHALEQAGFMVVVLHLRDKMHLGAELFRWKFATAVASSVLGINPFNQPDVEESKLLALQMTTQYEQKKQLHQPRPLFSDEEITLFTDEKNTLTLNKQLTGTPSLVGYLRAHLKQVDKDDYVNLSAFINMSEEHSHCLQQIRRLIRNHKQVATCLGFGPRFLHSTGQAYKGGPNTGVFLQITADHPNDIQVPTHQYTFGLVISSQAQADFNVLAQRSRRILRVHLGTDVLGGLERLRELIARSLDVLR